MNLQTVWEHVAPVLAASCSVLLVINFFARRIPASAVLRLESSAPRIANALRFCRAAGPDIDKALRALFAFVTGRPWVVPAVLIEDDKPEDPPKPPPATPSAGLLALVLLACVGCAATPHKVATDTVITAADVAQGLVEANDRIYTRATDELRASIPDASDALALYRERSAPLTSAYLRRADATAALSAQLYAAAGIIDLARHNAGVSQYVRAARLCLVAIDELLSVLADGALLPPVPVPPELLSIVASLRVLAGAPNE